MKIPDLRNVLTGVAIALDEQFNGKPPPPPMLHFPTVGLAIFVWNLKEPENLIYGGNCDKDDIMRAVGEWLTDQIPGEAPLEPEGEVQ